ncbi:hypothetical protein OJ998_06840 [Solirubrobacter taibaiensis]|nr:hypothetical protein [Solirubrobacter taibaiensis]
MSTMFLRSLLSVGVLTAIFAAPAQAAPELTSPLKPCYLVANQDQREPIPITATGFTPFSKVGVYLDDILQFETQVLVGGDITGGIVAPFQEEGTGPFTLRLSETNMPTNVITRTTLVTRLAVEQSPRRASTAQRVRFKGRGFMEPGLPVYAHYVFAGKVRESVRLGVPKGPCGTFSIKRPQFPFEKSPRRGKWTIQFDQLPHYNPKAPVRVPMTIRVQTTPKQDG